MGAQTLRNAVDLLMLRTTLCWRAGIPDGRVLFATINHSRSSNNQDIKSERDGCRNSFKKFPESRICLAGVTVLFPTHLPFRAEPIKLLITKDSSSWERATPPTWEHRH